jgi:UDP-N-acetylglucosamine transferase subunit ALG13
VIFVTVGTQLPFDRMVAAVDAWAALAPGQQVFAQIGPTDLRPRHIDHRAFVSPAECHELMLAADAIVAHAGMGTILRALELGKPLLVLPRRAALGEHRNDHQLATARRFAELGKVAVAFDEGQLPEKLEQLDRAVVTERIGPYAPDRLVGALRIFIDGGRVPAHAIEGGPMTAPASPAATVMSQPRPS